MPAVEAFRIPVRKTFLRRSPQNSSTLDLRGCVPTRIAMKRHVQAAITSCILTTCLSGLLSALPAQKKQDSGRPTLPYRMLGLHQEDLDAYDSKAEPSNAVTAAVISLNVSGWALIHKYFPAIGTSSAASGSRAATGDLIAVRYTANYANEGPGFSSMPLLCMIWSLPEDKLSGRLKRLHDELAPAMTLESYSSWTLDQLRQHVNELTEPATTPTGTKFRRPKQRLSFAQTLRLYTMTLALLRLDNKWTGKTDSPPPNMVDFTNRLQHQLPKPIADGATTIFLLYFPGATDQPLAKGDYTERADVVAVSRHGTEFNIEQFPVYFPGDTKEWSPSWITDADERNDSTLIARKFEHDWTRLDGPYLWYRPDLLIGQYIYRSTVTFTADSIAIAAERIIQRRGAAKRVQRPPDYDPSQMTAFDPDRDEVATPFSPFVSASPSALGQLNELKWPPRYFSNGFQAWCTHGRWDSGLAVDGKTWISVAGDTPRPGAPLPVAKTRIDVSRSEVRTPQ